MTPDNPIFRAWLDATNCFLAGANLPPLAETKTEVVSIPGKSGAQSLADQPCVPMQAAPSDDWPDCEEFDGLMQRYRHVNQHVYEGEEKTVEAYLAVIAWLRATVKTKSAATQVSDSVPESHDNIEPASVAVPIWTNDGPNVYKRGEYYATALISGAAWFVCDRLNAFDANLCERNQFQRMYQCAVEREKVLEAELERIRWIVIGAIDLQGDDTDDARPADNHGTTEDQRLDDPRHTPYSRQRSK